MQAMRSLGWRPRPGVGARVNRHSRQSRGLYAWYPGDTPDTNLFRDANNRVLDSALPAGSAAPAWLIDPEFGHVLLYTNAASKYIQLNNMNAAIGVTTQPFTIAFWFLLTSSGNSPFFGNMALTNSRTIGYHIWAANAISIVEQNKAVIASTGTVSTMAWHHFAWRFNGATGHTLFLDGAAVASATYTWDNNYSSASFFGNDNGSYTTSARMRDLRIYERAVSDALIYQMWAPRTRYELWGRGPGRLGRVPSGTLYDETGRSLALLALLGETDAQAHAEAARSLALLAGGGNTAAQGHVEAGRGLALLALLGQAESAAAVEAGRELTLLALTGATHTQGHVETGRGVTVIALLGETDSLGAFTYDETGRALTLAALLGESDALTAGELGRALGLLGQAAGGETQAGAEIRGQGVTALTGRTDAAAWLEANRAQVILAVLAGLDSVPGATVIYLYSAAMRRLLASTAAARRIEKSSGEVS